MNIRDSINSIPPSPSDLLLRSWGYDLFQEYISIIEQLQGFDSLAVELATGTGRMCSVLSHFFHTVITGDISLSDLPRAKERIPKKYFNRVQFIQLNMEHLPFHTTSIPLFVCINTLHEVENPKLCLQEMIRIVRKDGILVVGDFNRTGFDAMQKIHEIVYHNNHSEGNISLTEIKETLETHFHSLRTFNTTLNTAFFATQKQ